ncbi:MAG TPA: MFS transporter [Flavobacterium sp.]|nr:MFS transporter [Flavobacterium sp.]
MIVKEKIWNKNFIIACIANFLVACSFNLLMPTIPIYLSEEMGVEPSQIGIVLSSYAIALLLIRPFCGYWVDVYQRKSLFLFGLICFIAIYFGYYFVSFSVLYFVLLRFIHGLFWGLTTVSSNTVAIDLIPASRRAEGIGYFGVNTNIAMAIAPFLAVIIYNEKGFYYLISCALVMGALSILAVALIKIPKRKSLDKIPPMSMDRFMLIKGIPIFLNQLFITFGWGTLVAFAVLYGKQTGIENAGVFFLFLACGLILSRITSGRFVDRGHTHKVMAVALLVIAGAFVSFALFHSVFAFCVSAFFIGIGYGTLFPALQTIYINMAPSSKRGTANSTYLTGFDLGIGIGMMAGAYIADIYDFSTMYLITAGLIIVGLFLYWFNSKRVYERNKLL